MGRLIGQSFTNEVVYPGFLALAAGSILLEIIQLLRVGTKLDREGC